MLGKKNRSVRRQLRFEYLEERQLMAGDISLDAEYLFAPDMPAEVAGYDSEPLSAIVVSGDERADAVRVESYVAGGEKRIRVELLSADGGGASEDIAERLHPTTAEDYRQSRRDDVFEELWDDWDNGDRHFIDVAAAEVDLIVFEGFEGDDVFWNETGVRSYVLAGDGADYAEGGWDRDFLSGGDDDDVLLGNGGTDILVGAGGSDTLIGGKGDDGLFGGQGEDLLLGHDPGFEILGLLGVWSDLAESGSIDAASFDAALRNYYGTADPHSSAFLDGLESAESADDDDLLYGNEGNDVMYAGAGDDRLVAGGGYDWAFGGKGSDTVVEAYDDVTPFDNPGPDVADSDNIFYGGAGVDGLLGGAGNDRLFGGKNSDTILGWTGDDTIEGEDGDDVLFGNAGSDDIRGGNGNDWIMGTFLELSGVTHDLLREVADDSNTFEDYEIDTQGIDSVFRATFGGQDVYSSEFLAGMTDIQFDSAPDRLFGGAGGDVMIGSAGNDTVMGGSGNDWMLGGAGNDYLEGQSGDDVIYGAAGNDTIYGDSSTNPARKGNDWLYGGEDRDKIFGGRLDDWLFGEGDSDTLMGGDDDDRLYGGDGRDRLYGELGRDGLDGGLDGEQDWLFGGPGADTFAIYDRINSHGESREEALRDFGPEDLLWLIYGQDD